MLYRVPMQRREYWFEGPAGLDLPAIYRHFKSRHRTMSDLSARLLVAILEDEVPESLRSGAKILGLRGVYVQDELFLVYLWLSDFGLTPAAPGVVADDERDHESALQRLRSRRSHLARCR